MLQRCYVNVADFAGIIAHWSETIFSASLKENIVFVNLFETIFGNDILNSCTEFQCQGTECFGSIWGYTFEFWIEDSFLRKKRRVLL